MRISSDNISKIFTFLSETPPATHADMSLEIDKLRDELIGDHARGKEKIKMVGIVRTDPVPGSYCGAGPGPT